MVSLHQGTTYARRNRVLSATRIAAVLLVSALAIEVVSGGEMPLVHVEAALLR